MLDWPCVWFVVFIMWHMRFKKCKNGDGSTPMIFWGVNRVRIVYRPFWGSPRCDQCPNIAMDQYLYIPFLVGWTSTNPSYFDVNYRGTRFWPIPIFIHRSFSTATESMFFDTLPTYDGTTTWDMVGYGFVWKVFKSPTCWRREDRKDHESWYPLISNMLGIPLSPWTWNPYWQPAKENYVLGFWRFWALFIKLYQDIQYISIS